MESYWFLFCKNDLQLCKKSKSESRIPLSEECPVALQEWNHVFSLPPINGISCKATCFDAPLDSSEFESVGLRATYYEIPFEFYVTAGKAAELIYWHKNTTFCGVCGAPMNFHTEISKRCSNCGKEVWPQLATAIIVLVKRDDEVLLVHANNFKGAHYGLVAGFVETGETLEQCVKRELREETHIEVDNIRYYASQPWPYPCGLMVGFVADYASGNITLQREELGGGGWFARDHIPSLPGVESIARQMIDAWIRKEI